MYGKRRKECFCTIKCYIAINLRSTSSMPREHVVVTGRDCNPSIDWEMNTTVGEQLMILQHTYHTFVCKDTALYLFITSKAIK